MFSGHKGPVVETRCMTPIIITGTVCVYVFSMNAGFFFFIEVEGYLGTRRSPREDLSIRPLSGEGVVAAAMVVFPHGSHHWRKREERRNYDRLKETLMSTLWLDLLSLCGSPKGEIYAPFYSASSITALPTWLSSLSLHLRPPIQRHKGAEGYFNTELKWW